MMGIYAITNKINSKKYIGSSVNIESRWRKHISQLRLGRHYKNLQTTFNKYGEENFELSILEECEEFLLLEREDFYINKFNTCNRKYGYNINFATRKNNYSHSEETRKKISMTQMGRKLSEKHKASISKGLQGRGEYLDKETREMVAQKNIRFHISEEDEFEMRRLLLSGVKGTELAKKFNRPPNYVVRLRKRMESEGLLLPKKDRNKLIEEDLSNGLSINEISEKFKVTKETIRNKRRGMIKNGN